MRPLQFVLVASLAIAGTATLTAPARADSPMPWWTNWFEWGQPNPPVVTVPQRAARVAQPRTRVAARQPAPACNSILCGRYLLVGF